MWYRNSKPGQMGSLFNSGNVVINALLGCSEDSYIKSLQDLVNHIVKPDKLYLYNTGDKELWKFENTSEGEKLDVEYAIPNKKVKFSEEVVNEVNFILKLVKNNMKLVPGGTQMRFLIAADPDGVDPDGVGPSIRGGVDIGGKRRRSGEEKTKSEKGERKAQGSAIPTDKGNDDSKADKEQAVVLKGSAGEGGKDKKPAGRVDDQEGVGGQRKRKTRGRPKGKGKEAMADKEQEVETIGAELEEVPVGVRADDREGENGKVEGKRKREKIGTESNEEEGKRSPLDSTKIPTPQREGDCEREALKKIGATGADESGRGGEDQEEVVGRRKIEKTGTESNEEGKRTPPDSTKIPTPQRERDGEREALKKIGATGADESGRGGEDQKEAVGRREKGSAGEGGKNKKPAGRVGDQGVGGKRKRKVRGRPKGNGKEAMADKEQEVEMIGAELEEVTVGVRADDQGGEIEEAAGKGKREKTWTESNEEEGKRTPPDSTKIPTPQREGDGEREALKKIGATGADESGRGGEDQEEVVGRTGKEDKTGTWREKELKRITPSSTEISKISTSQREGDGERRAPRKFGVTGADESDHGERDEDQDAAAKRIKTEKTGTGTESTESTESTDYAYEYVNLVDGSSDTELPILIEREKEKRKRLEKERKAFHNATFQERILFRSFIMDRNLKSDPPESIKLIYEMPPWKQVKGGRRQQFTRTMSEQEKNWIGDTIYKLVYRSSWKFSLEERAWNNAIMNQLKREGYLKDYNLGFVPYGSLKPGEWLSAEVINSQGKLFSKREVLDKGNQSRFLIFNTQVYEMAHKALFTNEHHTVRDWPTFYSINSDLLDDDININNSGSFGNRKYLIFPVGNGSHFMLLIFNIRKWQLLVLDSLHPPDTKFQRQAAYLVITMVKSMLYLRDPTLLKPHKKVACYAPTSGPKQQDYCSCGVFCTLVLDAFTKGMNLSSLNWSSSFIEETRMKIAAELLKGELYD